MTSQEKLKALRKEQNLTTYELGQLCGMPQSTVSKLENGKRRLDLKALTKLAKALNVNVNELLEDENENEIEETSTQIDEISEESIEVQNRINGEEMKDITREVNDIMGKFYSQEGGPLFFNGALLEGENVDMLEHALMVALSTLKVRNKNRMNKKKED